jgi:chemotaxis protein CheZ
MTAISGEPELHGDGSREEMSWVEADGGHNVGSVAVGMMTLRQSEIPHAIEQLDDIVRGTEGAANQIMDACAALEAVIADIGGEAGERINDALTAIYEACGFQDLAGQRITNVTKTLGLIEGKLSELTSQFGILACDFGDGPDGAMAGAADPFAGIRLSGPQHPEDATDQASVDELFIKAK